MPLSSNSLIHLTEKRESLVGILQNNFRIFYCLESIETNGRSFYGAVPMVSFCDIPLSEIKNHIDNYGAYGIGLKKSWAKEKGLNPVLYIEEKSDLGEKFRAIIEKLITEINLNNTEIIMFDIFSYMKNYQGTLNRNGVIKNNYRFSDEREWRYVPSSTLASVISPLEYQTVDQKKQHNEQLNHLRLEFTPDDISYIFINNEDEINDFIDVLRNTKGSKYTQQQVERLMTRIFTTEQIKTDI
jgi:hypothetical protein